MITLDSLNKVLPSLENLNIERWYSFIKRSLQKGAIYTIKVIGNSMYPTFKDGSSVKIKEFKLEQAKRGDILVYKHWSTNVTIHRIIDIFRDEDKTFFQTKGDNNPYPDNYFLPSNEVIGVVVGND